MNAPALIRTDLLHDLHEPWKRDKLKGKFVHYRTRWDRETERAGTINKVGLFTLCMSSGEVFHHDDLITLTEVTSE